jgi:DNA-binding IclR family transcriptional regulator
MPITPSPAVLRACDVLEHLAAHPDEAFSVSELAREVAMPRATCDAVLLALAERALVDRREPDLRYTLGPTCIAVGDAARAAGSRLARVAPLAEALARSTSTCVALSTVDGLEQRVEQVFDHGPAFGLRARVGESVRFAAPFAAVFVAWAPPSEVDAWLDRAGDLTASERARYLAALGAVRQRGYSIAVANVRPDLAAILERLVDEPATEHDLRERDAVIREITHSEYLPVAVAVDAPQRVNQMSAPVFDHTGRVVVQIMVLGPTYDLTPPEIAALGERLLEVAQRATERSGGRADVRGREPS